MASGETKRHRVDTGEDTNLRLGLGPAFLESSLKTMVAFGLLEIRCLSTKQGGGGKAALLSPPLGNVTFPQLGGSADRSPRLCVLGASWLTPGGRGGARVTAAGPVMVFGDWFPNPAVAEDHRLRLFERGSPLRFGFSRSGTCCLQASDAGRPKPRKPGNVVRPFPARDSLAHTFLAVMCL